MKIWFDITNSPHINLFEGMIRDLQREHDVIITSRPLANTVELLDLHGMTHTIVGKHYGKAFSRKVMGYPVRVWELYRFLRGKHVDVAISQSSFHSPVVARMLGVRSIYMNDNEHAMGNIPSFMFASKIMVPEFLSADKLKKQFARPGRVVNYPGVKEGIYLWKLVKRIDMGTRRTHEPVRDEDGKRSVYVRPEPWAAQYYKGDLNFLDDLVLGLKDRVCLTLLPRSNDQLKHYEHPRFAGIRVIHTALDIAEIAPDCDLFIGAGGTMTREMAVLGVPTISVYQDELLDVDRYLLEQGSFVHRPSVTAVDALKYMEQCEKRPPDSGLLRKGRQAYEMIESAILTG